MTHDEAKQPFADRLLSGLPPAADMVEAAYPDPENENGGTSGSTAP